MKKISSNIMILILSMSFLASPVLAQHLAVTSAQVQSLMTGKKKVALIDVRPPEEYQEAHIPGAVNIPADRTRASGALLPKDKSTQLIMYCRGVG